MSAIRPDDATVAAQVEQVLRAAWSPAVRCGAVTVVEDKPGRRAVFRVALQRRLLVPTGQGGSSTAAGAVYAKWSTDTARAVRIHATLERLEQALSGVADAPDLPGPLALLTDPCLLIMREVAGPSVAEVCAAPSGPLAARLGRALAALHHCGAALPASYVLADELRTVEQWTGEVAAAGAPVELVERYAAAVERVAVATMAIPLGMVGPSGPAGVVHRDLHEEHCIVTGGRHPGIGIIDLDEARSGDPVVDLGHLAVHLQLRARRADADLWGGPAGPLLGAWADAAGRRPDGEALRAFGALACVKIARQRATGYGTAPRLHGSDRWPAMTASLTLADALLR